MAWTCRTFSADEQAEVISVKEALVQAQTGTLVRDHVLHEPKDHWDEIHAGKQLCSCSRCACGGVESMLKDLQDEYIMLFLMDLNDSYATIRDQILLYDLMPLINKVLLVIQVENQRSTITPNSVTDAFTSAVQSQHSSIDSHDSWDHNVTVSVRTSNSSPSSLLRRPRPQCTYCGRLGHTELKCYKKHSYPPGYQLPWSSNSITSSPQQNRVKAVVNSIDTSTPESASESLTHAQCQQMVEYLTTQM